MDLTIAHMVLVHERTALCLDALVTVDILYAAPQAHRIVNVALHQEYSPGIIFIFSQRRNDRYHV
jgi:hypothetical protein